MYSDSMYTMIGYIDDIPICKQTYLWYPFNEAYLRAKKYAMEHGCDGMEFNGHYYTRHGTRFYKD